MIKEINHKILLDKKGMSFPVISIEKGMIWLLWTHDIDLDLLLFYKTIDGMEGGVFSGNYRQKRSDMGFLHVFPHIMLSDNLSLINKEYDKHWEEISIREFDNSIADIYILIVNYDSTIGELPVDFTTYDIQLKIQYNAENSIEIPVNCSTKGNIYVICRILNKNGEINIINESNCISLQEAYNLIPGFNLICS